MPLEIREIRDKETDIRKTKKTVQEKEEVIQVLEKKIDELNTQIAAMQAVRGRATSSAATSKRANTSSPQQPQPIGNATEALRERGVRRVCMVYYSLLLLHAVPSSIFPCI